MILYTDITILFVSFCDLYAASVPDEQENAGHPPGALSEGALVLLLVNSSHHAVLSLLASLFVVGVLSPPSPVVLVLVGTVAGVGIDVDHFPISRARHESWGAARRVASNPRLIISDPERIFAEWPIHPLERLLSHVALAGSLTLLTWLLWPGLGVVLGASLYVHLLADLVWDVWRLHRVLDGEIPGI